eukprot:m.208425 g.208425  ORF g.208425 m.208425 type:complete len:65 (-) comp24131_c0_seq1:241-435(-)
MFTVPVSVVVYASGSAGCSRPGGIVADAEQCKRKDADVGFQDREHGVSCVLWLLLCTSVRGSPL